MRIRFLLVLMVIAILLPVVLAAGVAPPWRASTLTSPSRSPDDLMAAIEAAVAGAAQAQGSAAS